MFMLAVSTDEKLKTFQSIPTHDEKLKTFQSIPTHDEELKTFQSITKQCVFGLLIINYDRAKKTLCCL